MKLIFLNMSSQFEWDRGIYNRNKHILDEFAKMNEVESILSVDFLPFNFRSWLRLYLKGKIFNKIGKNIILFGHRYVAKRLNNKVISLTATSMKKVKKAATKLKFGDDAIIISYNPFDIGYFKYFKNNKKYFDIVDNWAENSIFSKYKQKLLDNYKFIIKNSNIVFTKPQKLKDDLIRLTYCEKRTDTVSVCCNVKDNIRIVLNGVDLEHYRTPKQSVKINKIFNSINPQYKIKIGYLGVIKEDRIDSDMLEFLVSNNKDNMFIIAGPVAAGFDKIRFDKYKNVIFTGEMSYDEMSAIYAKFDICIIPHKLNDFIKSMDPMKLYGYLAAGKPVVSVPVPGTEQFEDIIEVVNNKIDFNDAIQKISKNIKEYSSTNKILERQKSVEPYSWRSKAEEMFNAIKLIR